jgi:hypothetical protein
MALFPVNTRELRSFRLLQRTGIFTERLTTETGSTLYAMCDSLHPRERIEMRGRFVHEQGLRLAFLSKNVSQNLLSRSEMKEFRHLLQGHVVEIADKAGGDLTEDQLRFILSYGKFSPRLLIWRRQLYRAQRLRDFLEGGPERRVGPKLPAAHISQLLSTITTMPFLVGRGNVLNT